MHAAKAEAQGLGCALNPPEGLFSAIGGEPAPLEPDSWAAGEQHWRQTAASFAALRSLLPCFSQAGYTLRPPVQESRRQLPETKPSSLSYDHPQASSRRQGVLIEELTGPEDSLQQQADTLTQQQLPCIPMLLSVALYSADEQLHTPWTAPEASSSANRLLEDMASALEGSPPAAREEHLYTGTATTAESSQQTRSGTAAGQGGSDAPIVGWKPSASAQELLVTWFPSLAQHLRCILVQRAHADRNQFEAYTGPGTFARATATRQLAWWVRRLDYTHLDAVLSVALPCILAAVDDSSPVVQRLGLWALHHVATESLPSSLQGQRELLLDVAKRIIVGCDAQVWPAAAHTACALACCLAGGDVFGSDYAGVLAEMLTQGERFAHQQVHRKAWLAAMPVLLQGMRLGAVCQFRRLMPLVLPWCSGPDAHTQLQALRLIYVLAVYTWPRMNAHSEPLLEALNAAEETSMTGKGLDETENALQSCIAAELLHVRQALAA